MDDVGIKSENFYFIGILKDLNIAQNEKSVIDGKIKNFNFKNIIIICPENFNFLGVELYKVKKEEENEDNYSLKDLVKMFKQLQNQFNNIEKQLYNEKNNKNFNFLNSP